MALTARDVIAAGGLDRLIARLSKVGKGQIDRVQKGYLDALSKARIAADQDASGFYAAWREVGEAARLAVNRARTLNGGGRVGPAPGSIGAAGDPDDARATRAEYHVLVELRDSESGQRTTLPVVVTTSARLSLADLAALAGPQALADPRRAEYDARSGRPSGNTTVVRVILTGIVGI